MWAGILSKHIAIPFLLEKTQWSALCRHAGNTNLSH